MLCMISKDTKDEVNTTYVIATVGELCKVPLGISPKNLSVEYYFALFCCPSTQLINLLLRCCVDCTHCDTCSRWQYPGPSSTGFIIVVRFIIPSNDFLLVS